MCQAQPPPTESPPLAQGTERVTLAIPSAHGETTWDVAVAIAQELNLKPENGEPDLSVETIIVKGAKRLGIAPFTEGGNRKWKLSLLADDLGITHGWNF